MFSRKRLLCFPGNHIDASIKTARHWPNQSARAEDGNLNTWLLVHRAVYTSVLGVSLSILLIFYCYYFYKATSAQNTLKMVWKTIKEYNNCKFNLVFVMSSISSILISSKLDMEPDTIKYFRGQFQYS